MTAYLLAAVALIIAFAINWLMPRPFWRATLLSSVLIVAATTLGLLYLPLGTDANAEKVRDWVWTIQPLLGFFGILISVFVGWFLHVVRR
ncbi:hypothetical protein [Alteromonas sp. C1M14]|uniref:hypothetical protein n=1 Tax=Alteromonas sp. C1M14 TaxID=2841567 RepID=UPI001C08A8E8|nr:hypothetical protein [Alteromonas sp. C1M14]MBU2977585.1 hypothetical protein [Alteromonas sp. C1M14]